jgi:hypothetical protein
VSAADPTTAEFLDSTLAESLRRLGGRAKTQELKTTHDPGEVWAMFTAQCLSRHTDLLARRLRGQGHGYYTIGSAGHESNAAVALAGRPTDPALLHTAPAPSTSPAPCRRSQRPTRPTTSSPA